MIRKRKKIMVVSILKHLSGCIMLIRLEENFQADRCLCFGGQKVKH